MSEPQHEAPETAESPSVEARPEPRGKSAVPPRRAIVAANVLALVVITGTSPYWAPPLAAVLPWSPRSGAEEMAGRVGDIDQRATTLSQQQAAVGERLSRLEQQVKSATAAAPQQAALEQRLAALEQRLSAVAVHQAEFEQRVDRYQEQASASFGALREEMDKLEAAQQHLAQSAKEKGPDGTDQALLLLSLEQLRNAVDSGRAFAPQLAAMAALAHDRAEVKEALKPLESAAAQGVPDKLALARRFEQEVAPAMLRAAAAPREDSWSERVWSGLRSLVVIRRVDGTGANTDNPAEAAVARAEAALAANDLAGAVTAVEAVTGRATGPAQSASAPWLAAAKERVAAETALATLSRQLTARLAAGAEQPPPR
jgi:hypothetical protein